VINRFPADGEAIVAVPAATTPPTGFACARVRVDDHAMNAVAISRLGSAIRSFDFLCFTNVLLNPAPRHVVAECLPRHRAP
jgi:hypothetical protein